MTADVESPLPVRDYGRAKKARPYVDTFRSWCTKTGTELTAENLRSWDKEHNDQKIHRLFGKTVVVEAGWKSIFNHVFYDCLRISLKITPAEIKMPSGVFTPSKQAKVPTSVRLSMVRDGKDWSVIENEHRQSIIDSEKRVVFNAALRLHVFGLPLDEIKALFMEAVEEVRN